ncbi:pre-mRNA-processing protein 40A-like isoform X2 [Macadamia integrifolia]|uniref:pre-mRNA-processing protein 40A-like isoform X2 n=1 Tax=Macadamia integrifolia TaxID=60698 RepID=UPI001C4EB0CE|nr:pre-mRNA-processing protein 40A-like isoform X2 [Macadamia integrifolia]
MANNPQSSATPPLRPPPIVGSAGPPQNFAPPMSMQFRPMMSVQQQGQMYMPAGSQQFRPVGQGIPTSNVGMPPSAQGQQLQYSQPIQQLPPRPGQPGHSMLTSSQTVQMPYPQPNMPSFSSGSPQPQQNAQPMANPMGVPGSMGMPLLPSYTFTTSYGQPQSNVNHSNQYQPISQMHAPNIPTSAGGQSWLSSASQCVPLVTPIQQATQQQPVATNSQPNSSQQSSSDWQEHTSADGRRYYYNKKTRVSSWEKPLELMTPVERADASTVWKEFTTQEGRKYYYNKVTKLSKWTIPDELRLAREQAEKAASQGLQSDTTVTPDSSSAVAVTLVDTPSSVGISIGSSSTVAISGVASSPVPVTPVVSISPPPVVTSGMPAIVAIPSAVASNAVGVPSPAAALSPLQSTVSGGAVVPVALDNATTTTTNFENVSQGVATSIDGASAQDLEEAKKGMAVAGKTNVTPLEEKTVDEEPLVYANKQEAKNAFKALLESANVEYDWTWEQAMRVIINDKRYGALKSLGERKQAFNEYLGQRKKQEAEERRIRQKRAREEFTKMLEESKELTSSTRWSKAISMFEDDERFKAVERARDREDLFENYLVELEKKERAKAQEEHKRNIMEYRQFLESCDFIKANSQWRKVQDRLEDDERCSRLEKIDRLEIFQEYLRDLEKEDEEHRKIEKEQQRRAERKNRDEFRKLMEEHVAEGMLAAKTHWRDYFMKVKELPAFIAVSKNTSGSTPKDLFEDVVEELENQYHDDKTRIKDGMKLEKINMASSWTFEDFKASIIEVVGSPTISDINLKLVYEELIERIKEKEEKEAKKRQHLADDFTDILHSIKEITASSKWEDSKSLFEDSQEYRAIGEENFRREVFEEYVTHLQEKAKEKERKREEEKAKKEKEREEKEKRKDKERKEKERERERDKVKERSKKDEMESENVDVTGNYVSKEEKKREKDKDRKHRKRHHSAADDVSSDKDEKEESKKSRRHSSDRKKSRKHAYSPESDGGSRHKRHKRDHRDSSRRNGGYEELEDGELGEDGEIRSRGHTKNDD